MVKNFIKRELSSDTFKYVLLLALVVALVNYNFLSQFKQLPSPLYGGDYYNHLGSIYHIYYGRSIFENGQMLGEIQWAPWLYHSYVVILSKITGVDPLFGIIYSSLPLIFVSAIIVYLTITRFTENRLLILSVILIFLSAYPIYKYTLFAFFVTSPLMILAWFLFLEKQTQNRFIFLAIAIAFAHLSSTQLFFASIILFGVVMLDLAYKNYKKSNTISFIRSQDFIKEIMPLVKVFALGFLLYLVYWYAPLFVYKGATPNDLQIYGWPDYTKFDLQIKSITDELRGTFFAINFDKLENVVSSMISILELIGAIAIVLNRNINLFYRFVFLVLVAALIGLSHHLILFNLLHTHLAPGHLFQMMQFPLEPIEILFALIFIKERIKLDNLIKIGSSEKGIAITELLLVLLAIAFFYNHFADLEKNKGGANGPGNWVSAGRSDLSSMHKEIKSWILSDTSLSDVFLTTNEGGFMLNALSGRKVVTYRRTHAPVYSDMNQRALDAAVMLYGKNDAIRKELLKKYNVKYLFWSVRWFEEEFIVENSQIVGFFDPLMVKDKPDYRDYLDNNGVRYVEMHTSLDPYTLDVYPKYTMLVTGATALESSNIFHPWEAGLDKYLKPVKFIGFQQQGDQLACLGECAIIYEVSVN